MPPGKYWGRVLCKKHEVHIFLVHLLTLNVILTASLLADGLCGPLKPMSLTLKHSIYAFLLFTLFQIQFAS